MSLSLDFTAMLTQAFTLINGLWPIFIIPVGFTLGLGLLAWIVDEISKSVRRH
jgi:hypothetical protein